jgi:hypothetical protein
MLIDVFQGFVGPEDLVSVLYLVRWQTAIARQSDVSYRTETSFVDSRYKLYYLGAAIDAAMWPSW